MLAPGAFASLLAAPSRASSPTVTYAGRNGDWKTSLTQSTGSKPLPDRRGDTRRMTYSPPPPVTRWWMHERALMRYDPMNAAAGHVRITDGWPAPGVQRFFVRHYPDRDSEPTRHDFRDSFAEAIQLAEEWLP